MVPPTQQGGLLAGYAPGVVVVAALLSTLLIGLCCLAALELLVGPIAPRWWPDRVVAAIAFVLPVTVACAVVLPSTPPLWSGRGREPQLVHGRLVAMTLETMSPGLGMLSIRTRQGVSDYLCESRKLHQLPGNAVEIVLSVRPQTGYVLGLVALGPRRLPRSEPGGLAAQTLLRRLRLVGVVATVFVGLGGVELVAALPVMDVSLQMSYLHAAVAVLAGAVPATAVFLACVAAQQRWSRHAGLQ